MVVVIVVESLIAIGSRWVHGSSPARPLANVVDVTVAGPQPAGVVEVPVLLEYLLSNPLQDLVAAHPRRDGLQTDGPAAQVTLIKARDADSQRIPFEFAEFAANSFAARIRSGFGLKFLVLRIRGKFALRIRRRRQNDHACAVFTPDEKLTLNCAMQYIFGLDTMKTMMILLRLSR